MEHESKVVVKFADNVEITYERHLGDYLTKKGICRWSDVATHFGCAELDIVPLIHGLSCTQLKKIGEKAQHRCRDKYKLPSFANFLSVPCPSGLNPNALVDFLRKWSGNNIETVYIEGAPASPPSTAYLEPASVGINVKHAWKFGGGKGDGVILVDIEQGWDLGHPTLPQNIEVISGCNLVEKNHGTAVLEVLAGPNGIARNAEIKVASQWHKNSAGRCVNFSTASALANAIAYIESKGKPGVILLEAQTPSLLPIELEEEGNDRTAIFALIQEATSLGIIVVEAAGNGNSRLDALITRDSGALIVGACTSAGSTERLPDSNFGGRVDCFAQGEDITTTNGSLRATSGSASIVAGAVASLQGVALAQRPDGAFDAHDVRKHFRENGTQSSDGIGSMPDLSAILTGVMGLAMPA